MLRKLVRRLFPYKDLVGRLTEIEKRISEYQGVIDYLVSISSIKSSDAKDLAYFFRLKRNEAKGQIFQDLWVLWETRGKTNGFFVEFGAADGVNLSNTFLLEDKYNWKGILAEPMPGWHSQLIEYGITD
jgi:hypothetical protein